MDADLPGWARDLRLQPHPEGGWFVETWRSCVVPGTVLPPGYAGGRAAATAILFLLLPGQHSAWHLVRSDELWLAHRGAVALEVGGRDPAGPGPCTLLRLGTRIEAGESPQQLVPGGYWQRASPDGDEPALVSCVVSPGFDFGDFRLVCQADP
ncbi:MAG TPA: cupin domain-containing protein [Kineosporiaceae bacterium]|jgi:predicted cupin superfamily sugar epimerase|nr:cupin domain-containing protein [Kineosporiaceae bacterium]